MRFDFPVFHELIPGLPPRVNSPEKRGACRHEPHADSGRGYLAVYQEVRAVHEADHDSESIATHAEPGCGIIIYRRQVSMVSEVNCHGFQGQGKHDDCQDRPGEMVFPENKLPGYRDGINQEQGDNRHVRPDILSRYAVLCHVGFFLSLDSAANSGTERPGDGYPDSPVPRIMPVMIPLTVRVRPVKRAIYQRDDNEDY